MDGVHLLCQVQLKLAVDLHALVDIDCGATPFEQVINDWIVYPAALPGVAAAHTDLPVIGVPILGKSLGGLDALLSAVQMPPGVPVACVAIDGAKNAGVLATRIINLAA